MLIPMAVRMRAVRVRTMGLLPATWVTWMVPPLRAAMSSSGSPAEI